MANDYASNPERQPNKWRKPKKYEIEAKGLEKEDKLAKMLKKTQGKVTVSGKKNNPRKS